MPTALVNVTDYGAIGATLTTTGRIHSGSQHVTVAGPAGWRDGTGIGILGAGPGGTLLVTTVQGTPAASTTVDGARVISDDGPLIQRAIDSLGADGGGVYFPRGTYTIGIPNATLEGVLTNAPLFIGSNVTLRGDGIGQTVLRVCDGAMQIPRRIPAPAQMLYPTAALMANRANTWWHSN